MTFQPVVPLGGSAGWAFLNRTKPQQTKAFNSSPAIKRETSHFRETIATITSAADLVKDRQLLKVALGAFGLDDDIDKRFFVRKVLEEGTDKPTAMANRLVDKRYARMSTAFGFGSPAGPRTGNPQFIADITAAYETRQFEIALGKQNEPMRFALSFQREIVGISATTGLGDTGWLKILGSPPLKEVVEKAFNLPDGFTSLNLDKQVSILRAKSAALFGSDKIGVFADSKNVDTLIHHYLARADSGANGIGTSSASTALTLLRQNPISGSATLASLFAALH